MSSTASVLRTSKTYLLDLAERVAVTFLQAFVGGIVITQPLDASMWYAATAGAVGAVVSLVKGLIARLVGDSNSASVAPRV